MQVIDDRHLQTPFPSHPKTLLPSANKWRSLSPLNSPRNSDLLDETPTPPRRSPPPNDDLPRSTPPYNKTSRSRSQPPLLRLPVLPPLDILSLPDPYPLKPRPTDLPARARTWSESTPTPTMGIATIAVNTDTFRRTISNESASGATKLDISLETARNTLEL